PRMASRGGPRRPEHRGNGSLVRPMALELPPAVLDTADGADDRALASGVWISVLAGRRADAEGALARCRGGGNVPFALGDCDRQRPVASCRASRIGGGLEGARLGGACGAIARRT